MTKLRWQKITFPLALAGIAPACDAPAPPDNTGGTSIPEGPCGRGLVVLSSDYQSTNVSLFDWEGAEVSGSIVSSGSSSPGLSSALSGDVTPPTQRQTGARIAIIDRFPASVITWLDVASGEVAGQLSVQTGFAANPQDLVQIADDKAYVSRYEPNPDPGSVPFDAGSDILVIDPGGPSIVGRIDLGFAVAGPGELYPRPSRMVRVGDVVYALLSPYSLDFVESGDATVAAIDTGTDAVVASLPLPGLRGCRGLAVAPSGQALAVACSGSFAGQSTPSLDDAGVALIDLDPAAPGAASLTERTRFAGPTLGAPPAFSIDFASEGRLILPTFGELGSDGTVLTPDRVIDLDLDDGSTRTLAEGPPFSLGEVGCGGGCGRCFVTDADAGDLLRIDVSLDPPATGASAPVFPELGLPPRYLGAF